MKLHQRPDIFDSAVAQHLYDNQHHFILFDIAPVKGLMQVFREAVEIKKKHIHEKVALDRDTGETSISPIYDKIISSDRFQIYPEIFVAQSNTDNNLSGKRLAFKSTVSKMKL